MKTITVEGKISFDYIGKYDNVLLTAKDGYVTDLMGRVRELKLSFPEKKIQVNYWTAKDYCSKDQMLEGFLAKIFGKEIDAEYQDNSFMGSSWTGLCESYDTELRFGGHDFMRELKNKEGQFIIIDFNIEC